MLYYLWYYKWNDTIFFHVLEIAMEVMLSFHKWTCTVYGYTLFQDSIMHLMLLSLHYTVQKASNHHANLPLEMYSFTL